MPALHAALWSLALAGQVQSPADPVTLAPLYEQVVTEYERDLGPNDPKVARSSSDLGLFLKAIGDPRRAEAPLRKALAIDERNHDPQLAADQENLAEVLDASGRHTEAFRLFQQAAAGTEPAAVARSLAALAVLDPAHAESYYRDAVQAEEAASGKDHPRVAILLNDLALALRERNDNQAAEPLFRRALAIQIKALGPNHPAAASTLNNLGSLLEATGRLAEAERAEREAMRIFEERFGPESKELATACSNLADVLWTKGDRTAAAPLYRRTLSVDESIYGPDHTEVAGDLRNLGMLLKEMDQGSAADALLRRALAIYESKLGRESPQADDIRKLLNRPAR